MPIVNLDIQTDMILVRELLRLIMDNITLPLHQCLQIPTNVPNCPTHPAEAPLGVFLFNTVVRALKLDGNGLKLEEAGPNFSRFNDIPEKKSITPMVLSNDIGFISFS